jgi:hypothetical protein
MLVRVQFRFGLRPLGFSFVVLGVCLGHQVFQLLAAPQQHLVVCRSFAGRLPGWLQGQVSNGSDEARRL